MRIEKEYLAYTIDKARRNDYISLVKLSEHYLSLGLTHMAIDLLEVASKHSGTYYAQQRLETVRKGLRK
ncbi:hypothetical protein [Bathymodiolus japonicus methanotrophic gill symbiont]|uniref:hypothetical protein n=1 Tax=Bathymodiolus japonicus methanotrophic gill symbiont TaxID=113269 RepID=UPI001C8E7321|nr:hypothetical protein [Bathymodiolus japonicus methanotrophic gill symbiont]